MNLDNSFRTGRSDAYAMRLHSVHPSITVQGSPDPTRIIENGVRYFFVPISTMKMLQNEAYVSKWSKNQINIRLQTTLLSCDKFLNHS